MTNDDPMLVLVVDGDQGFLESTRTLLRGHRTLSARDLDEAREIVLGGRVDVVVLGPGFASEHSVVAAAGLRAADPTAEIVLAADIVTNRLLKAALRAGFADVVDLPLTAAGLASVIPIAPAPTPSAAAPEVPDAGPEISVMVEPATPAAPAIPPHHPSQFVEEPEETLGSGSAAFEPEPQVPGPDVTPAVAAAPSMPDAGFLAAPSAPEPGAPTAPAPVEEQRPDDERFFAPPSEAWAPPAPVMERPVWPEDDPVVPEVAAPPAAPSPPPATPPIEVEPPAPAPPSEPSLPTPPPMPPPFTDPTVPPAAPTVPPPAPADLSTRRDRPRSGGRVIAVMAGKGGSGKSVVATNLAIAMGMRHDPERVAIVDADLQFGDVALMLQIDPVRTIDDVIGQLDSLTDARLDSALLRHESGLRVLPAPLLPVRAGEITAKSVVEVVDRLRGMYDTIVVDTGPVFDDGLVTILEHADAVVTVVDMDLPSVKNAKVALDALRGGGFPMERITMVVNRVNSKARLDLVELERSLGLRVGGSVPSDRLVPQSVNEGIPLLALSPRSKVARSFLALAERLDPSADRDRLGGANR